MKLTKITTLFLLASALPLSATADDLSWTWVEGGYNYFDVDGGDGESGYRLAGSLSLPLNFYIFGEHEGADLDTFNVDATVTEFGGGFHLGLGELVQGLVEVAYSNVDVDFDDDDGYTARVGVRFAPGETFEFGAKAGYRDLDAALDGGFGEAYFLWKVWGPVGVVVNAELADDANRYMLGVRASF